MEDGRERAIEAITQTGRETRAKHSRAFWIAALVIGAIGIAAFIAILGVQGERTSSSSAPAHEGGFATGLAIGVGLGIAIGFAIARRSQSSRPHSERNKP